MGELRGNDGPADRDPEGDKPEKRPDQPSRPEAGPPKSADDYYNVDREKLSPVQRQYARDYADNPPDAPPGGLPYTIDWKTGKSLDDRKRTPDGGVPDEVGGVHDPIEETRPYGEKGGLNRPDHAEQARLEAVVPRDAEGKPEKFPSMDGEWTKYVNGRGPFNDPLRGNNCLDCSLAAIATWHGEPTVAAPRTLGFMENGDLDTATGETNGPLRAQEWIEGKYKSLGLGDGGYATIEKKLLDAGPGSSAAIVNSWDAKLGGGAHAWNAFNDKGKIVWYDPQRSVTSDDPVHRGRKVEALWAVCLDPEGKQL